MTSSGQASLGAPVSSGALQVLVLSCRLFIMFIDDLPDMVHCSMKLFPADTKMYCKARHVLDLSSCRGT